MYTANIGVGTVLSQGQEEHPIAYFSQKLLDRERNYLTIEKECIAVVLSIKLFDVYLLGKPFILQTDHKAVKWLQEFKEKNSHLTRWSLSLQPFIFTVKHTCRKGTSNANADTHYLGYRTSCKRRRKECDRVSIRVIIIASVIIIFVYLFNQ